jgi:hypothetical protein
MDHTAFISRVKQSGPEDECTMSRLEIQFLLHRELNISVTEINQFL